MARGTVRNKKPLRFDVGRLVLCIAFSVCNDAVSNQDHIALVIDGVNMALRRSDALRGKPKFLEEDLHALPLCEPQIEPKPME